MKFIQFIFVISIVIFISCKTTKQTNEMSTKPAAESGNEKETAIVNNIASDVVMNTEQATQITNDTPYRLTVSFISIGEGTDSKGKEILDSFLKDWTTKYKQEIRYETVQRGREGEVNFYFPLSELKEAKQKEFVSGIKDTFKGHDLVKFSENEPKPH